MRFSEHFGIEVTDEDDWFDPHLSVDTKLFIDPLLLLHAGGQWAEAHAELIAHFVHCYRLVAKSAGSTSVSAKAARRLLTFPEPDELGLGYTSDGTRGSGSGYKFAERMADGIAVAISAGLDVPEHIEEIGILNEGIGADRISDCAANVIKSRLIDYTSTVAKRHGVPVELHRVKNARVDLYSARWIDEEVLLPTNPVSGRPILLLPRNVLRELPTLNADDWFGSAINEDVRTTMNIHVGQGVRKANIVSWARLHPDRVRTWARAQTSRKDLKGYDFHNDRLGIIHWDRASSRYAVENPLPQRQVVSQTDIVTLVGEVVSRFKHFVEQQRGWSLLWNNDGSEKPEEAAQLLFLGLAQAYLREFNVELDREVELGRGPVDFKVSSGTSARLLIEIKKVHNGKFWNGLNDQLLSYLTSDSSTHGWFVAIRYRDAKSSADRVRQLPTAVGNLASGSGMSLDFSAVDARRPLSASKLDGSSAPGAREVAGSGSADS